MRILLFLLGICMSFASAFAQNCTQKLNQAEDEYVAGRLSGIPNLLNQCLLLKEFSDEEEIRARKLLTQVYIFSDQESKAENALVELLKKDPEHRLNSQVDPAEMFFLYDQYRTKPIFRVALRAGVNASSVKIINDRGLHDTNRFPTFYNGTTTDGDNSVEVVQTTLVDGVPEDTTLTFEAREGQALGFWAEILFERHIKYGIELGFGSQFRMSSYNADNYNLEGLGASRTHRQINLRAPLIARYTYGYDDRDQLLLPYAFIGASFDYLLDAQYVDAARFGGIAFTSTDQNDLIEANQVVRLNYSFLGGLGVKLRAKTHFFTVEFRYDTSRRNLINGGQSFSNKVSTFDLGYVEPDLSMNFLSFSIGYTRSIYSPKKL